MQAQITIPEYAVPSHLRKYFRKKLCSGCYVCHMVDIFRDVRRVLRKDGTVWLNIGDSYAGSWGAHKQHHKQPYLPSHTPIYKEGWTPQASPQNYGLKPKDLCLIPFRLALALQDDGWWVRSVIIWAKKNCMPESCRDRPTTAHEYVLLLAKSGKSVYWTHREYQGVREEPEPDYRWVHAATDEEVSVEPPDWRVSRITCPDCGGSGYIDTTYEADLFGEIVVNRGERCERCEDSDDNTVMEWQRINLWRGHDYYYDADAIREPISEASKGRWGERVCQRMGNPESWHKQTVGHGESSFGANSLGRNKRTVWELSTEPRSEYHFAIFPRKLITPMILAGSSPKACPHCGSPWERIVDKTTTFEGGSGKAGRTADEVNAKGKWQGKQYGENIKLGPVVSTKTTGWRPTCDCKNNDGSGRCIVLDPFAGSGTTPVVAANLGRDWIGIEANADYIEIAKRRIQDEAGNLVFNF